MRINNIQMDYDDDYNLKWQKRRQEIKAMCYVEKLSNWQGLQQFLPREKQIISFPHIFQRILLRKRYRVSPWKAWG